MTVAQRYMTPIISFILGGCSPSLVVYNDTATPVDVGFALINDSTIPELGKIEPNQAIASHACASNLAFIYVLRNVGGMMRFNPQILCRRDRCGCEINVSQLPLK